MKRKKQSATAYPHIRQQRIDRIVTSPLKRALETAMIVNQDMQLPLTIVDELQECCFGAWEGKNHDDGDFLAQWMGGDPPKDGESHADFKNRVMRGLTRTLGMGDHVLIVSHGGVYACIAGMMGWPILDLQNCEPVVHQPHESGQSCKISSL